MKTNPTLGVPVQFVRNGQTLTVEWKHFAGEPSNDVNDSVEVLGVYDIYNDELPYNAELYADAEKAILSSGR